MPTLQQLETALRNADAAGDTAAATALAREYAKMRSVQAPIAQYANKIDLQQKQQGLDARLAQMQQDSNTEGMSQAVGDSVRLLTNGVSLGFLDKALGPEHRAQTNAARDRQGYPGMGVEVLSSMAIPGGLAAKGITATRIPTAAGKVAGMGIDGAAIGATQAMGNDKDVGTSALTGLLLASGGQAAMNMATGMVRPIISRAAPQRASDRVMAKALESADMTPATIADDLSRARADGQDTYAVMDALGHPGQRLASTVVRTPNEGRMPMVNFIEGRQSGQGNRITNALVEGFNAPKTAAQQTKALEASRTFAANADYGAARGASATVDTRAARYKINDIIGNPQMKAKGVVPDSIEATLIKFRDRISGPKGKTPVTGFDQVLRLKQDMDDAIDAAFRGGHKNKARLLGQVRDELDAALESASMPYAQARDKFREASRVIDSVDDGTTASQRGRSQDVLADFNSKTPEQQAAYRVGYAEPLIAKTEQSAFGVNKARPLINDKYGKEFPALAAPGKADQLGRRIRREQTMFETRGAASGGSKTADNLADEAGLSAIDPSIIGNMLTGQWTGAARSALLQGVSALKGQPASVRERIAKALMETDPVLARAKLTGAVDKLNANNATKAAILRAMTSGGVAGAIEYQR